MLVHILKTNDWVHTEDGVFANCLCKLVQESKQETWCNFSYYSNQFIVKSPTCEACILLSLENDYHKIGEKPMLEKVLEKLNEIEAAENKVDVTKQELSDMLVSLKEEKGASFEHNGTKYQIRARDGRHYICVITKQPGRKKAV